MRVLLLGLLLLSACGMPGHRAADVREINFGEGGRDYKGDGHGDSVTFRRDGTAEEHSYTMQHDIAHDDMHRTARFSTDQFERLAKTVLANHSFAEDSYRRGTDSGQSITVVFSNGEEHHASFSYDDAEFRPIVTAINDLSNQLQWQDAPD